MKRFEFKVILHIIVIFLLSISSCLLYQRQLWFSTTVCILLLIGVGIHLYRIQFKQIALLRQLTDGLRYNDITQNLHPPFKNKMMDEWAQELSNALKDFRGKLLAEEIKHQYYENLLNKVDTAVLVTDVTGHIEWMNQAAVTHLGQLSQLPEVLQEASTSNDISIIRIEQNGIVLEMAISCTTFVTQGAFATQSKKQRLISLKNIHSVLERNEMEAWQKLIRVLTHEIMNSIAPIISLSETVTERASSNGLNERDYSIMLQAMQTIHRRSKGLLDFVENYRKLTRIPVPMQQLFPVSSLFDDLRGLYPAGAVSFSFSVRPVDLRIYADRAMIEQVLINLLKNAVEACQERSYPEVRVNAFRREGVPVITVSDNGYGIVPEAMDKVFVPFFTTKQGGSGIGLSVCRQIMNRHGGSISVISEEEKGTTFTLQFPQTRVL